MKQYSPRIKPQTRSRAEEVGTKQQLDQGARFFWTCAHFPILDAQDWEFDDWPEPSKGSGAKPKSQSVSCDSFRRFALVRTAVR